MPDDRPIEVPPDEELLAPLHRAGWSIGDTAFSTESGGLAWVVSGSNGEDLIRAEGPTRDVAWRRAVERAREVGMLGAVRVDQDPV
jgi:hypothetical protein